MNIVMKKITELKEYENNPRNNETAIDAVANSISEFGFKVPIIITKDNVIVTGHTRLKASIKLNLLEVPCIVADDLTEEQIKAFRLVDNKTAEIAGWDFSKLEEELSTIEMDMAQFGFEELEDEVPDNATDDDFDPDDVLSETPYAKLGDIFQLGTHRVMCGDSTNKEDVGLLMNGNKADMLFTDPPYLMGFTGNVHSDGTKSYNAKYGNILNDKLSREDGDVFIYNMIKVIQENVIGSYYISFYRLGLDYIFRALDKAKLPYRAIIIWSKGNHTLSNSDYMSKYEPIVYGWVDKHTYYGPKSNYDIWDIPRTVKNDLHPTMKPLELVGKALGDSSKVNNIILDLFGGSGSTLIACEQLDRICYMMELDEKFVDVIIKRYLKHKGSIAECYLIRDGKKIELSSIDEFKIK